MRELLIKFTLFLILPLFLGCNAYISDNEILENENINDISLTNLISENKKTIYTKVKTPKEFIRVKPHNEFAAFINNLPLKSDKLKARLYDGSEKINDYVYIGVIDLIQPKNNVQYNGNAIIRLRAEYLYRTKQFDRIDFKINPRQDLKSFKEFAQNDFSQKKFNEFIEYLLYNYNPNTLHHHLKSVSLQEMQIGDIFVQRSQSRGHAAIVIDMATDEMGNKLFLLAQAFYPGQDIYIASNLDNEEINPWYVLKDGPILTPEWRFMPNDLMRFK